MAASRCRLKNCGSAVRAIEREYFTTRSAGPVKKAAIGKQPSCGRHSCLRKHGATYSDPSKQGRQEGLPHLE